MREIVYEIKYYFVQITNKYYALYFTKSVYYNILVAMIHHYNIQFSTINTPLSADQANGCVGQEFRLTNSYLLIGQVTCIIIH